ncbi:hypothetical protein WME99_17590 [Sorangium sp. So ce136]|uniref:hypothetical protein n=1 Tax=Sorangium sp. So ce136 TaxID=3133284 RepID=UPI003F0677C0
MAWSAALLRRPGMGRARGVSRRAGAALVALLLAAPACGDDERPPPPEEEPPPVEEACKLGYLGEEGADIRMEVIALDSSDAARPVSDGDGIDIIMPPQGGRVLFLGVRATNLSACGVQLSGSLRDLDSGRVMSESRTVNLKPTGDGWGASVDTDISTFANVGVCPNNWSGRNIFDEDYEIVVQVKDREGRMAKEVRQVRPACNEPEFEVECRCICKHGYILGEACE